MNYSAYFLEQLAAERVMGDFPPFSTGSIRAVESYIKAIIGRLKTNYRLIIVPDFTYYGSGFASYISIRISKKNTSDSIIHQSKGKLTQSTDGILLYLSNLTPYWYYGASQWTITTEQGKVTGGSSGFLRPESIDRVDRDIWKLDIEQIKALLGEFRYQLLTKEEVSKQVDLPIKLRTELNEKPYEVFDYFFYWYD